MDEVAALKAKYRALEAEITALTKLGHANGARDLAEYYERLKQLVKLRNEVKVMAVQPAKEPTVADLVKEIQNLTEAVKAGKVPVSADLNADGKVTPGEQATFDIFKTIIEKTQKNALLTNALIVVFCILSFLFSVLPINI